MKKNEAGEWEMNLDAPELGQTKRKMEEQLTHKDVVRKPLQIARKKFGGNSDLMEALASGTAWKETIRWQLYTYTQYHSKSALPHPHDFSKSLKVIHRFSKSSKYMVGCYN